MKKQILTIFALIIASMLNANNISLTDISLNGQNTSDHFTMVQFDISWENSWRNDISGSGNAPPYNRDAAWVFVKYRVTVANGGDGLWKHACLNNTGHITPGGCTIDIGLLTPGTDFDPSTNPGMGAHIYRDANGTGTFSTTGVQLRWNYGVNYKTGTIPIDDNDMVDIQVFALEMVYVPQSAFALGSGGSETSAFYKYPVTGDAYSVISEDAITIGTATDNLYYEFSTDGGDQGGPVPASFPKGYNSFYCMKYEICQQEYTDFLNTLTYTQQTTRTTNAPSSGAGTGALITGNLFRNGIDIQVSGVNPATPAVYACNLDGDGNFGEYNDGQWIACNYLSWNDVVAYLDWSSLRPMTELEFEKSCRGSVIPVVNEYAWGNTSVTQNTGITNPGQTNETSTNNGNASYGDHSSVQGPTRVGGFATASSTRLTGGTTYFGIMEMSSNVWERAVSVGNTSGRLFTGTHGNGTLDATGNEDVSTWPPGIDAGIRGGYWTSGSAYLRVSDRSQAAGITGTYRLSYYGGRGVRLAL